jgi:hypothetical protein
LQAITAKLFGNSRTDYFGTAWLCSRNYALTAAHCVGDRLKRKLRKGSLRLAFDWGEVKTLGVKRVDFDIDAALLGVPADEIPGTLSFTDFGVLPGTFPLPQGPDALWWSAFGFPRAHPNGMVINGVIDSTDGGVKVNHAMQLTCEQGGFGALNGISGAAIIHNEVIVGLVRYGPPVLKQKVIYAAPMSVIVNAFPELKEIKLVNPIQKPHAYSTQQLADALAKLLPAQFESVIFNLNVPSDVISGPNSPRRTRAIEVVSWAGMQGEACMQLLVEQIIKEAPSLLLSKP